MIGEILRNLSFRFELFMVLILSCDLLLGGFGRTSLGLFLLFYGFAFYILLEDSYFS